MTTTFRRADVSTAAEMSPAEAIQYHYDNDTRFFSLWLDSTLSYSSARWQPPLGGPEAADLEAAQRAKIEFHLDAARVPAGGSLIDIGCGWGAVLAEAVARGAARAEGLTLSADQHAHIEAAAIPGVVPHLADVFEWQGGPFDAAISIGAFEHFAKPPMDRGEKVATYANFFERIAAMLIPGARFSLQTIVWDALSFDEAKRWIPQTVFPQSDLPFIEEVIAGAHDRFRLVYAENGVDDYPRTLEVWIANLRAVREEVVAEWGEEQFAFFEHYLRNSRLAFLRRKTALARFVFVRR